MLKVGKFETLAEAINVVIENEQATDTSNNTVSIMGIQTRTPDLSRPSRGTSFYAQERATLVKIGRAHV